LKNKNSFQHVVTALEYEQKRQARVLNNGGEIEQATLLYDLDTGRTSPMRSKEDSHEYRYFPEPDLVPVEVDAQWVEKTQSTLPELPADRRKRFVVEYDLPAYDAQFLTATHQMADFFDKTARLSGDAKASSNWIMSDLSKLLNGEGIEIQDSRVTPVHISQLIELIKAGKINGKIAKSVLVDIFKTGRAPNQIVEEKGLSQISDASVIESIVDQVIAENPGSAQDYRNGKKKAIGFLVGQVMRATKGKANPQLVNQTLQQRLEG
jgi:aspartyl-tRNA(Asn)/glutamyl-tRNA(Gln) amidotransferase subunit B